MCVFVSGAGRPHVHLFGELQDEADVGPLVGIWVDTHTDQISELQHIQAVQFKKLLYFHDLIIEMGCYKI